MRSLLYLYSMLMSSRIFLLSTLLVLLSGFTLQLEDDFVLWGTRNIYWQDFKEIPEAKSTDEAHISYSTHIEGKYITRDSIIFIVKALMNPHKSWTKTNSDYILEHERRHFDLTEIYARKTREAYSKINFSSSSLNKDIKTIFDRINNELDVIQDKYDNETEHSKNKEKQQLWDKKIKEELKQLEAYSNTAVPLKVDWNR